MVKSYIQRVQLKMNIRGMMLFAMCLNLLSTMAEDTPSDWSWNMLWLKAIQGTNLATGEKELQAMTVRDNDTYPNIYGSKLTIPGFVYDSENNKRRIVIGGGSFSRHPELKHIKIKEGVQKVGDGAFNGCSLISVDLPDGLIEIDNQAFRFGSVFKISIPSSVIKIESGAFSSPSYSDKDTIYFNSINVPEGGIPCNENTTYLVPSKAYDAYKNSRLLKNCKNIKPYIINDFNINDGDVFAMQTTEGVELNFKILSAAEKTCQVGTDDYYIPAVDIETRGTITIPPEIDGIKVTSIGTAAFRRCKNIEKIIIHDNITTIGNEAFGECENLTSFHVTANIKQISSGIFNSCHNITSITVDKNNPYFDSRDDCNAIVKTSTNELLYGCKNTIIPQSIYSISDYAFLGNRSIRTVFIPENVTTIKENPYKWCPNIESVIVSEGNRSFESPNNCNALINKTTQELVIGCQNTIIPKGVTKIGAYAFTQANITTIDIPESVTSIGGWAFDGSSIQEITLPVGCTTIESCVFQSCSKLKRVFLPSTLKDIGHYVFNGCFLLEMVSIDVKEPIDLHNSDDKRNFPVFNWVDKEKCIIYVPNGSVEKYKTAEVWKEFTHILPMSTSGINMISHETKTKNVMYNLQGNKIANKLYEMENQPKGIYIINGKKVLK